MSDFTVLIMASHRWIVRSIIIFLADEGWGFSTYITYPNSCTVETLPNEWEKRCMERSVNITNHSFS